ncbi:MAG: Zn-dependent alcohol dehydrogenase [Candidatus Nanopelagicales bacterium]|tara:strand:- start:87 stop:1178 length:1092 start_codon:yes stop_codon:yes gene_type:complete
MKAAVLEATGGTFVVQEVQIDNPISREVRVDVKASGLCHSDLNIAENGFGYPVPAVLGHEISGIVSAIGPDVSEFSVGDHVVGSLISHCGRCGPCLDGKTFQCHRKDAVKRRSGQGSRLSRNGVPLAQTFDLGGFAEQALVHENNLVKVSAAVPFGRAALLGCGVITGAGAAINTAGVRVGDTVAVIGCGGVGLNVVQGAAIAGARRIIAIDLQPSKLALALKFGATDTINPLDGDLPEQVRSILGTDGVNHSFEAVGLKVTASQALAVLGKGGGAYLIGMQKPGTLLEIDPMDDLIRMQKRIQGVWMGSTNSKIDIPMYADLYVQGRYNLDDLVSQTISLDEINEGYDALRAGEIARTVITF